jgi:tetratricopeptide (TPR) repeat protein
MASSAGNALSLIKAVLDLIADRATGVLDVRSEGVRTQIYVHDGKPLFAEDEAPGETFGRLLMRQGVITNEQFVRVIDEMTRAATGDNPSRFGEVAVGLGVLTREQVERGLAEQVCGIIARSLQRGASQWTFEATPAAASPPRSFALQINAAVLAALRESADRSAVANVVAARPDDLVVVAGPRPPAQVDVRGEGGGAGPPDAHAARMSAEQAFQKGVALLRDAKMASAAIELRRASDLQPDSLEYQLYAAWAKARSYREIPAESDQKALLDLAQKAKRHDPLLAFASYVIGQVSMWSGDDDTAKKWFYEALRLDPASEAGQQVRILARRAPPAQPPPAAVDKPVETPAPAEPAPPRPAARVEAPAQAAAVTGPAKAPARRSSGPLVMLGLLLAAGAVVFAVVRNTEPRAEPAPSVASAATEPAVVVDAAAPAVAAEHGDASVAPEEKPLAAANDADMGTVLLPSRAAGHRIFVDGRRAKMDEAKEGTEPLRLPCGRHVIQIGSSGSQEAVDLPCGGEVQLQ